MTNTAQITDWLLTALKEHTKESNLTVQTVLSTLPFDVVSWDKLVAEIEDDLALGEVLPDFSYVQIGNTVQDFLTLVLSINLDIKIKTAAQPVDQRVLSIIKDFLSFQTDILPSNTFEDDLYCDDLDFLEITMEIEDVFQVALDDNRLENITTVQEFINLLKEALAAENTDVESTT